MRRRADSEETYVTSAEAARQLGVALRTVQLWVERGILRAWKTPGGHRRILQSSIDEVLQQRQEALRPRRGRGPLKVLLVEDDHHQRDMLQAEMAQWPMAMHLNVASNGYDALIQSGRLNPDLAILDLMMPGLDGFQLIHTLTRSGVVDADQVIALTALGEAEIRQHGGLPENVTVLQKPIPPDVLRSKVEEVAGRLQ